MFRHMRFRFMLVFIGLAIGPIVLIALVIGRYSFTALEEQSLIVQQGVASSVSTEIRAFIESRENELLFLDVASDFTHRSLAEQRRLLSNLLIQQTVYQELALLDLDGQELIRVSRSGVVLEDELRNRATDVAFVSPLSQGEIYLGSVHFDETIREPLMTISVPLIDLRQQKIVSVLVAEMRFKTIWRLLAEIEQPYEEVYVLDPFGRVIAHKNPAIVLRETTVTPPDGAGRTIGLSGADVIYAKSTIRMRGQEFIVVAEQPVAKAWEVAINVLRVMAIVTAAAFMIAITLVTVTVRQMVKPIERLADAARAISGSDFSLRVTVPGNDELGQLAAAFNQMATNLEDSYAAVNANAVQLTRQNLQLEQKTIALTDANQRLIQEIRIREQTEAELQTSNQQLGNALGELQEAQQKMVQQERLAVVGQLSAGIAHDFNNILTTILGFSELLQRSPKAPQSMQSSLDKITVASRRAADLVRQLLDFSRKTIRQPKQLDLTHFVRETIIFLEHTIPENIHLDLDVVPEQYWIEADPAQLQQAIVNLAINARDAMPTGGKLRISLSQVPATGNERCAGCGEAIEGMWGCITVTDTGSGIPSEDLPHIFEPFFTSKEAGKGTGLGLAQVYGIVKQHAGHITLDSCIGRGTQFSIYLPLLDESAPEKDGAETLQLYYGQGETILLVEDDPAVRDVSRTMLENLQYHVLTAGNGTEALEIYHEQKHQIALVLSDMVMPDLDGAELFHLFKAQDPEIKMAMMSGYPLGETGKNLLAQGAVAWMQKPISLESLSQTIGKVLEKHRAKTECRKPSPRLAVEPSGCAEAMVLPHSDRASLASRQFTIHH